MVTPACPMRTEICASLMVATSRVVTPTILGGQDPTSCSTSHMSGTTEYTGFTITRITATRH